MRYYYSHYKPTTMKSKNNLRTFLIAALAILVYSTVMFIWNEGMKDAKKTKETSEIIKK